MLRPPGTRVTVRVAIDLTALQRQVTGCDRYLLELVQALATTDLVTEYVVFMNRGDGNRWPRPLPPNFRTVRQRAHVAQMAHLVSRLQQLHAGTLGSRAERAILAGDGKFPSQRQLEIGGVIDAQPMARGEIRQLAEGQRGRLVVQNHR